MTRRFFWVFFSLSLQYTFLWNISPMNRQFGVMRFGKKLCHVLHWLLSFFDGSCYKQFTLHYCISLFYLFTYQAFLSPCLLLSSLYLLSWCLLIALSFEVSWRKRSNRLWWKFASIDWCKWVKIHITGLVTRYQGSKLDSRHWWKIQHNFNQTQNII